MIGSSPGAASHRRRLAALALLGLAAALSGCAISGARLSIDMTEGKFVLAAPLSPGRDLPPPPRLPTCVPYGKSCP